MNLKRINRSLHFIVSFLILHSFFWKSMAQSINFVSVMLMELLFLTKMISLSFFYVLQVDGSSFFSRFSPSIQSGRWLTVCRDRYLGADSCAFTFPRLRMAFLPLLLHLLQSQLDFLINFFAKSSSVDHSLDGHQDSAGSKVSTTSEGHAIPDEALLPFFQASEQWHFLFCGIRSQFCIFMLDFAF